MRVKLTYPATEVRGGLTNSNSPVFFPTTGSQCTRRPGIPADPLSERQIAIRQFAQAIRPLWRALTPAQLLTWTNYAAATPILVHGVSTYINAAAWFSKINSTLLFADKPTRTVAPAGAWAKSLIAITSLHVYAGEHNFTISLTHSTVLGSAFIRIKIHHFWPSQNHAFPLSDYRLATYPLHYSYQIPSATLGYSNFYGYFDDAPFVEGEWNSVRLSLFRYDGRETNSLTYQFQVLPPIP